MPEPGRYLQIKSYQNAHKEYWNNVKLEDLPNILNDWSEQSLSSGERGLYIQPHIFDEAGKKQDILPSIDVENKKDHSDITQNIEVAKAFYLFLNENNLTTGLSIHLTGLGFRFRWNFIIPKEYKKAFMEFLKDFEQIDTGFNGNKFDRCLAYRGNSKQGKILDVHTHKLEKSNDLMLLDANKYNSLVSGRPDQGYLKSLLPDLIPNQPIPAEWIELLNHYKMVLNLKDSIFTANYTPPGNRNGDIVGQVLNHLDNLSIQVVKEKTYHDNQIYLLNTCPICNRSDGSPYLTVSGSVKCYHTNSCEAGELNEQGKIKGLRPSEWIEGFVIEADEPDFDLDYISKEKAREDIVEAILGRCDSLLISCEPGTGKSHTTLKTILPISQEQKILVIVPEKKLIDETCDLAKKLIEDLEINPPINFIKGRSKDNCIKYNKTQKIAKQGFSISALVCQKCPKKHNSECEYYKQFKALSNKTGLIITTHAQARYIDLDKKQIKLLIIDENPSQYFLEKTKCKLEEINKLKIGHSNLVKSAFSKIQQLAENFQELLLKEKGAYRVYSEQPPKGSKWQDDGTLFEQAEITPEEIKAVQAMLQVYEYCLDESGFVPETFHQWQIRLYKMQVNMKALEWVKSVFFQDTVTNYIQLNKDGYEFISFKKTLPNYTGDIIILDGTGEKADMDNLFKRDFEVIETHVELINCKKVHINKALGKTKVSKLEDEQIKKILQDAITHLKPTDEKILISTFKKIEDRVFEIAKELMPNKQIDIVHYWSGRGVNAYKHHDAIIAFGTPNINQVGKLDEAMTIYEDEQDRLEWFRRQGEHDLYQTIQRIRAIQGNKTIIVMGKIWPTKLGGLDYSIDTRRGLQKNKGSHNLDEAFKRLDAFYQKYGFIARDIAWGLGVGTVECLKNMQQIQNQMSMETPPNLRVVCLIKNILLDKSRVKMGGSKLPEIIILPERKTWQTLLNKLKAKYTNAPDLWVKSEKQKIKGLGSLTAVKSFYKQINQPFNPEIFIGEADMKIENFLTEEVLNTNSTETVFTRLNGAFIVNGRLLSMEPVDQYQSFVEDLLYDDCNAVNQTGSLMAYA